MSTMVRLHNVNKDAPVIRKDKAEKIRWQVLSLSKWKNTKTVFYSGVRLPQPFMSKSSQKILI